MLRPLLLAAALIFSLIACTNIDCPLDSVVAMQLNFYDASSKKALTLTDSLTVYGLQNGQQQLLYNRGIGVSTIGLPLNPASNIDTLLFQFSNTDSLTATDTLILQHQPQAHFESIDCPAAYFHHLISAHWSSHPLALMPLTIDSAIIVTPKVQYNDTENIKLYLRSAN